MNTIWS